MIRRIISLTICLILICAVAVDAASYWDKVTVYAPDGRKAVIAQADKDAWLSVGWYGEPVTTVYAPDGRKAVIAQADKDAWLSVGWYGEPVTTVYAPDGREAVIAERDLSAWINVGWLYEPPTVTLYSNDLRKITVHESEVDTYLSLGWHRLSQVVNFQVTEDTNPEIKVLKEFAYNELENHTATWMEGSPPITYDSDDVTSATLIDCDNDGELELVLTYINTHFAMVFDACKNQIREFYIDGLGGTGMTVGGIRCKDGIYYFTRDYYTRRGEGIESTSYILKNGKLSQINSNICTDYSKFKTENHNIVELGGTSMEYGFVNCLNKCFDLSPITMYCRHNYSTIKAYPHEIAKYLKDYYTIDEEMTIYSYKESKTIARVALPKYTEKDGWYQYPVVDMYAPNGTMKIVPETEVENWKKVGWYDEKYWELGMSYSKLKGIYPHMYVAGRGDLFEGETSYFGGQKRVYILYNGVCYCVQDDVRNAFPQVKYYEKTNYYYFNRNPYITKKDFEKVLGRSLELKHTKYPDVEYYNYEFYYDGHRYLINSNEYGDVATGEYAYIYKD